MRSARPASFDSATVAASSVVACLTGRELPPLGKRGGEAARPLVAAANHLPDGVRRWLYAALSGAEGQPTAEWAQQLARSAPHGKFVPMPGPHTFVWMDPQAWAGPIRELTRNTGVATV